METINETLTYRPLEVSIQKRNNLMKLAMYLLSYQLKAKFEMTTFADDDHCFYSVNCGTVGCAVGHGPYAGIRKLKNQNWIDYAFDKFIVTQFEYDWLFNACWHRTDNTPEGTAKRILYTLKFGVPNEDRLYRQMGGKIPLIYDKFSVDYLLS